MKPHSRRIAAAFVAVVVFGVGIWAYLFHARGEWALADYKKQLQAAGEKLTFEQVLQRPAMPEQNSVGIFRDARLLMMASRRPPGTPPQPNKQTLLETNPPSAMRMVAPGKAMTGWAQPDLREEGGTNSWAEVEAELVEQQQALELLEQIIERPVLDFNLDYRQGFTLLLPHLAQLKGTAQILKAAAVCDVRHGNSTAAVKRIRTMLALVTGMENEPLIISQLVRISMSHIALATTWELLQSPSTGEAELAELQDCWANLRFLKAGENALVLERAMGQMTAEQMKDSSTGYRNIMSGMWGGGSSPGDWLERVGHAATDKTRETMWRYAWADPDQLRALKGHQVIIEALRKVEAGQPFLGALQGQVKGLDALGITDHQTDKDSVLFNSDLDPRFLFSQSVLEVQRFNYRILSIEAGRQLVITAIALKRFQLKHGAFPGGLTALVPEFLREVPRDPVDGQPLRYKLSPNGTFVLYSINEDGQDDGGDATPANASKEFPWQRGKDLVWPTRATDTEISTFRAKRR